jgi:hypothetical protein
MDEVISAKQNLFRQVVILRKRFVQRCDLYARQLDNGSYVCVREPLSLTHLLAHMKGQITLGTYILDQNSNTRFIVFDADDDCTFKCLVYMSKVLAKADMPSYLEESRRGGHVWLFFAHAMPGSKARAFGRGLLAYFQVENIELFPKQDKLTNGPGSLIRMPFGVHRLSGRRYDFFRPNFEPLAPTIMEQITALSDPKTVPEELIKYYQSYLSYMQSDPIPVHVEHSSEVLSEQIKVNISVFDFVSRYVELKNTTNGAAGLCPFHDDHRPSFSVNVKENYWHCFAGCGGGSIIDFWMKWQGCDFTSAVTELAHMLL